MITLEDLIKYDRARDVGPVRETTLRERNTLYDEQSAKLERDLNRRTEQAEKSGQGQKKITLLEKEYNASVKKLEADRAKALSIIEQRFDAEAATYERRLEDPSVILRVSQAQLLEQRKINEAQLAEKQEQLKRIKTEAQGVQRESAERQAGRMRARGGRGSRQMLSSARLSPQPMGVGGQSTLGEAPF